MEKENRLQKIAKKQKQFEIYLEYMRRYTVLKLDWVSQKEYAIELNNIWQDMTIKLNCSGGPIRDATHWKKVFTEWKSHTRRKLKYNKPLNKIEKELIDLAGLTSMPERKRKSEKLLKVKSFTEGPEKDNQNKEKERNASKDNVIIKDELIADWNDSSSSCSFIEGEVNNKSCDTIHTKSNQGKSTSHISYVADNGVNHRSEQQEKIGQTSIAVKKHYRPKKDSVTVTRDVSVQVSPGISAEVTDDGLVVLSKSLITLSKAVNRYCDIVERRIF